MTYFKLKLFIFDLCTYGFVKIKQRIFHTCTHVRTQVTAQYSFILVNLLIVALTPGLKFFTEIMTQSLSGDSVQDSNP